MTENTCLKCGGELDTGYRCVKCGWRMTADYADLRERARELASFMVPCGTKDLLNEQAAVIESLVAERDALREALIACVAIAKAWHNMDGSDVWHIYYDHSPEMKPIREVLDTARREER